MRSKFSVVGAVFAAFLLTLNPCANATPYASGVRVNAGVVTFILNESADNVTVILDGGASTQDLGARAAGTHNFSMGAASSFEIVAKKDAAPGYLHGALNQISSDSNILNRFTNQRGVAVNKNPTSPVFGRIYVSVSTNGTSGSRSLNEGIYVLNGDQSEVTGLGTNALTGGLDFITGLAESPHRITVGPDDNLYIGDWSDAGGTVYVTDADVGNGQNILPGLRGSGFPVGTTRSHGSISAAWIEGSLAAGNLTVYVIDEDLQTNPTATTGTERNSIWRWDVGAGPFPAAGPPVKVMSPLIGTASQLADMTRGPDGKWYLSQRRAEPATTAGVYVRAPDGSPITNSLQLTRAFLNNGAANDLLGETAAVDVSPDGKWLAVLRRDTNSISLLPMTDGIPDMTNRVVLVTQPSTGVARDLGFDAAGNLYYVSSGQGFLRVLSPGGRTITTTRSDGTFTSTNIPIPFVTVTATDAEGAEEGSNPVTFTLTRNNVNLDQPLTVNYALTGLAANGTDYPNNPLAVTFPANETTATVTITPTDDSVAEFTETIVLTISPTIEYAAMNPSSATATILDNEFPALRLTGGSKTNIFEPLSRDTLTLTVSKLGRVDGDIFTAELLSEGVAAEGIDFVLSTNYFAFPPGAVSQTVTITPLNDFDLEGTETIVIRIGPGSYDYNIDAQDTVTRWIRDDEQAPAPVLFSEDFTTDPSANWQTRFGANNGIYDATVDWHYDYSAAGIGPAPNTRDGSTLGLFAAVNKTNGAASGSAGINFYPIGQTFSGDYALRFDMFLSYGTVSTTEHAMLGINHSGNYTNRATQSPDANNTTAGGDGFWVGMVTDASNLEDYSGYTYPTPSSLPTIVVRRAASTLTGLITSPPYALAGSPGSSGNNKSWAEVELSQVNNLISLKVNDVLIWQYQNTSAFTSGDIMLGMSDQFDSIPTANANQHFVVFDNVRVINLSTAIRITRVELLGGNQIQIDFTSPAGGDASGYTLRTKASLADANWSPDGAAQITPLGGTEYRAVTTRSGGGERFYSVSKP